MAHPQITSASPELAQHLAALLAQQVSDVVICPGSRNSPLSLALLARRDLRVHVRLDERAAAFCALGMARIQQRHVAVVMTSGTAVANCLPAMVEAYHSGTPLLVLSADRPEHLVGSGASQTIQQKNIFGEATPHGTHQVSSIADLKDAASWFQAPQVHINVALDVPLLDTNELPAIEGEQRVGEYPYLAPLHPEPEPKILEVDLSKNTVVIAGDEAWEVPGLEDIPTLAEPTAPAPHNPIHPLAASLFGKTLSDTEGHSLQVTLEQVIVVGHPTLHRAVLGLMANPEVELVVLSRTPRFTNPACREDARLGTAVKVKNEPTRDWLKICSAASDFAASVVREVLEDDEELTGLHAAAAVADTLAVGDTFFVGASNPIRDAAMVGLPFDGVSTISPRGTAGIDGTLAQAIGVALAQQSREAATPRAPRTLALVGDISFLHDMGGLLIPELEVRPENLSIIVANDGGCGIFETLETGSPALRGRFERAFGTPHGINLEELCQAMGINYTQATSLPELIELLVEDNEHGAQGGIHVIEVPTARGQARIRQAQKLVEGFGL